MRDPIATYYLYSAAWNEKDDPVARTKLLEQSWAPEGQLFDDDTPGGVTGPDALSDYIAATHEEMPGLVISESSEPRVLGNRLSVTWAARWADTGIHTGTDFVEFADDGRISRVTMFIDPAGD